MSGWEYKVVPARTKGIKGKGIKGPEGRFAKALETLMNEMGAEGWEFQRAETLPSVERSGLTGSTTEWRNVMVFRRTVVAPIDDFEPGLLPPPSADEVENVAVADDVAAPDNAEAEGAAAPDDTPDDAPFEPSKEATEILPDNSIAQTGKVAGMTASLKSLASRRNKKDGDEPGA